jgi:hypothetical protein
VRAFCLCNVSMGYQRPFLRLCLCLAKLRFPAAETGVGGTLGNNFRLRRRNRNWSLKPISS